MSESIERFKEHTNALPDGDPQQALFREVLAEIERLTASEAAARTELEALKATKVSKPAKPAAKARKR
jgi:hypothetical protein